MYNIASAEISSDSQKRTVSDSYERQTLDKYNPYMYLLPICFVYYLRFLCCCDFFFVSFRRLLLTVIILRCPFVDAGQQQTHKHLLQNVTF